MADPVTSTPPPARKARRSVTERIPRGKPVHLRIVTPRAEGAPVTRGECKTAERPCPWLGCSMHLATDVTPAGSLQLNFPDLDADELTESCALDLADRGENDLDTIGQAMGVTRERVRQIEASALRKLNESSVVLKLIGGERG